MVNFLGDGLGGGANRIQAKINSLTVNADLLKFGFVVIEDKSLWEPVQNIIWLGTILDTNQGFISVTEHRITKLKSSIDSVPKGTRLYHCKCEISGRCCRPDYIINALCR